MYQFLQARQFFLCQASRQPNSRSLLATTVPAGSPCSTNDICSFDTRSGPEQLCPADPATSKGTCPFILAGDTCQSTGKLVLSACACSPMLSVSAAVQCTTEIRLCCMLPINGLGFS
ncbi:hypothetical protein ABBQ32_001415 [Trebouxia sp. C0010 RCD-2024]